MADYRISTGTLHVTLEAGDHPALSLVLEGREVGALNRIDGPKEGGFGYQGALPEAALRDGITILAVLVPGDPTPVLTVPIIMGEVATGDMAQEIASLRAELDLVKRALRRMHRA